MKLNPVLFLLIGLAFAGSSIAAGKVVAGPKGGRLLENASPTAEFFVNADRKVEINLYDSAGKPVGPGDLVATVTAESPGGRKTLELEKAGTGFVSKRPLPEGAPYRVVVQLRETAEARPKNYRIQYDPRLCAGCDLAEYACTCGH